MNADHVLLDYEGKHVLNDYNRIKVVKLVTKYLMDNFGQYPSTNVKKIMAKAVITVFPCQRYKESKGDGTVIFMKNANTVRTFIKIVLF